MPPSPDCFKYCPHIFDAAENAAQGARTGVVVSEKVAKAPVDELIVQCEAASNSDCAGPIPENGTVQKQGGLFGRKFSEEVVLYRCGRTGEVSEKPYYLFTDKRV